MNKDIVKKYTLKNWGAVIYYNEYNIYIYNNTVRCNTNPVSKLKYATVKYIDIFIGHDTFGFNLGGEVGGELFTQLDTYINNSLKYQRESIKEVFYE